ncbi:MAG TPA: phospholipase A [Burkholderiales bacterium]|nr:phospholipase A [Burkholderiales bacterium]
MRIWKRKTIGWCFFLSLGLPSAAQAEWLFTQLSERARAGEPLDVGVVVVNDTDKPMDLHPPERLPVRLVMKEGPTPGELRALPPLPQQTVLKPGEFRKYRYRIVLPQEMQGPLAIEMDGTPHRRLIVLAEQSTSVAATPDATTEVAPVTAALRQTDTIPQPALQTNEPMYFLVGRRDDVTSARFQLSFKYRLFDEKSWLGILFPPAAKFYFGYTQTSLWDLSEPSAPFRDTAYKPSIFYLDPQIWASADGNDSVGLAAGLEHESNGRSDLESRSINIAYVQPTWRRFVSDDWYVSVSPKIWTYLDKDNNDDIAKYRGYADLNLRLGRVDGWLFSANFRKGTEKFGSLQLDASYPLRQSFFANAGGFIHFQYFNGYGESLLDYDVKGPAQLRVGFSIVR